MKLVQFFSWLNKPKKTDNRRRYHLGLDWGTSATKLVLRDYEQGKAFVIFPPGAQHSYRYPSTVVLADGKVYFGYAAEKNRTKASKCYEALKADIYQMVDAEDRKITKEDLATLYLAHVISIGLDVAEKHANRGKAEAVMGMTLGVPAEELDQTALRDIFLRMARTAYEIAVRIGCNPQEEKLDDCMQALKLARERIVQKDEDVPLDPNTYKQWLRPELAAAMYWALKSPQLQDDLYSCIDIGAWTTNTSYFRVHSNKTQVAFYGGSCQTPGMMELLRKVAYSLKWDISSLFGHEKKYLSQERFLNLVNEFREKYFSTWKKGFHQAYIMEPRQNTWDGQLNVMVVGGGAKIPEIVQIFHNRFPLQGWCPPIPVPDLGIPADLYEFPRSGIIPQNEFSGDDTFLLVAYGLSVHSKDFPETRLTSQIEPFIAEPRVKRFHSSEELGYAGK